LYGGAHEGYSAPGLIESGLAGPESIAGRKKKPKPKWSGRMHLEKKLK